MTLGHGQRPEPSKAGDVPTTLTGRTVLDTRSAKVGKVTDVVFDDDTSDWAIVNTGLLTGERFVPLDRTYVDADGRLIVPLYKAEVKRAPRVGGDHVITSRDREELRDYYSLGAR